MNIIIFGPNGSGKGTQSSLIRSELGLSHIETGDIFRENVANKTNLGLQAKRYIENGELVPDEITIPMILATLKSNSGTGWLLDGFPRNILQAQKLRDSLQSERLPLDIIVEIKLDREIAKKRIIGRRTCVNSSHHPNNINIETISPVNNKCRICHSELKTRSDDQDESAIKKRQDVYFDEIHGTLAAMELFKSTEEFQSTLSVELNGNESIENINAELLLRLKNLTNN